MSDLQNPKCPYCGAKMENADEESYYRFYVCPICRAGSPLASTWKEAHENALRRPLQKPLTLEETTSAGAVWLEDDDKPEVIPALVNYAVGNYISLMKNTGRPVIVFNSVYGKRLRCWARKPTDYERAAALWEV